MLVMAPAQFSSQFGSRFAEAQLPPDELAGFFLACLDPIVELSGLGHDRSEGWPLQFEVLQPGQ